MEIPDFLENDIDWESTLVNAIKSKNNEAVSWILSEKPVPTRKVSYKKIFAEIDESILEPYLIKNKSSSVNVTSNLVLSGRIEFFKRVVRDHDVKISLQSYHNARTHVTDTEFYRLVTEKINWVERERMAYTVCDSLLCAIRFLSDRGIRSPDEKEIFSIILSEVSFFTSVIKMMRGRVSSCFDPIYSDLISAASDENFSDFDGLFEKTKDKMTILSIHEE